MAVQLLRNTRVWLSTVKTGHDTTNTFEIQVGDDLSFTQGTASSTVEISEAGAVPTRGTAEFNDNLEPASWSFTTYIRSYTDGDGDKILPDALLWHGMASGSAYDKTDANGLQANDTNTLVKFTDNAHHNLMLLQVYMLVDNIWYHIEDAQVNEASIANDITDIAQTAWSGEGTLLNRLTTEPFDPATVTSVDCSLAASYIKNKLTVVKIKNNTTNKVYDIPVTGGSITINNGITYLTPSTLSCLDVPIGSFTGAFSVTGEITAYLNDKVAGSAELLDDLLAAKSVTNSFEIALVMGGESTGGNPAAVIVLPTAQVQIPSIASADVIGTTINFTGIGSSYGAGDEVFFGFSDNYTDADVARLIATGDGKA
ncbi:major tail protein [Vibrio phage VCPH]|nr:major tail protein [Vibrio phage VCPH]